MDDNFQLSESHLTETDLKNHSVCTGDIRRNVHRSVQIQLAGNNTAKDDASASNVDRNIVARKIRQMPQLCFNCGATGRNAATDTKTKGASVVHAAQKHRDISPPRI
jgi:hypothetical protein